MNKYSGAKYPELGKYQRKRKTSKIEEMFRREKQIEQAVLEYRNRAGGHTGGGASGHSFISDPTAAQAMRCAEEVKVVTLDDGYIVRWPERWLRVIRGTYAKCPGDSAAAKLRSDGYGWSYACANLGEISMENLIYKLEEIKSDILQRYDGMDYAEAEAKAAAIDEAIERIEAQ